MIAIRVENLGKRYRIGQRERYYALRDVLARPFSGFRSSVLGLGSRLLGLKPSSPQHPKPNTQHPTPNTHIWALKDVSFEVKQGEVVGIIGRNGAGKTTLLKILARITEPTEGYAEVRGQVGSLLEVGTGFHPELTGRENIYLSGAILGMTKREIDRKFDEIVTFAEIEKFLDTPVKYYSTGMYVRLAFAVAAHLEPEILLVDEVLAVGDAAFQKKCLGKMEDVAREGRTVLFVSHNMAAVENLCQRGIVLDKGRIAYNGQTKEAISYYLNSLAQIGSTPLRFRTDRRGTGELRVVNIEVRDTYGNLIDKAQSGQDIDIFLYYETLPGFRTKDIIISIVIFTQLNVPLFNLNNRFTGDTFENLPPRGALVCRIHRLPLAPSTYRVHFSVRRAGDADYLDYMDDATQLTVVGGDFYGTGAMFPQGTAMCLVDGSWRLEVEL